MKSGDVMDPSKPHQLDADDVVAVLRTDPRHGLTDAEVRSRLEEYGRNELASERPSPRGGGSSRSFRTYSSSCCSSPPASPPACGPMSATRPFRTKHWPS